MAGRGLIKEGLLGQEPGDLHSRRSFATCELLSLTNHLLLHSTSIFGATEVSLHRSNAAGAVAKTAQLITSLTEADAYVRAQQMLSVEGQRENVLGVAGCRVSIADVQVRRSGREVTTENTETNG